MQLLDTLDWLNHHSLYYNTLTNRLLFDGENSIIDHILIIGTESKSMEVAGKAT